MNGNRNLKEHWEKVYSTKALTDVSWYEPVPETSLSIFREANLPLDAAIIDVGGGDSLLVDHLLDLGYSDVTVLDISGVSLNRAKARLGERAKLVHWIETDVTSFKASRKYDLWHDRAVFHFLGEEKQSAAYLNVLNAATSPGAVVVMATFSESGPDRCSGMAVKQYSENSLASALKSYFQKIRCFESQHRTPFNTIQHFLFCLFKKPDFSF